MSTYMFQALNNAGEEIRDEVEAASSEDAITKIREMGFFPTQVKEKGAKKKLSFGGAVGKKARSRGMSIGRVSKKQLTTFTRQLSTLQDAGLPVVRSIKILESQLKSGTLKNALLGVAEDVEGGATLSEAMAGHPRVFDRLYCNMVRAGEAGGVLDTILQRLAEFLEKSQKLKKKIISAMVYPAVVSTFALGVVAFVMVRIVPQFDKMFAELDVELPPITRHLITVSQWSEKNWPIVLAIPFALFVLIKLVRLTSAGRYVVDRIKLMLPVFGVIINKTAISRFCRTLGTLITSGVPILEALNIVRETSGNEVISRAIGRVHDSIREGESIAEPLRESRVTDAMVVNMIDVGEETGDLDKMLIRVADVYDEDVDSMVAALVSLLEPMMILFLGGAVGFIVIALFSPLVALMNQLGGK
ncbi:MAG: type II secretion system F family protein [Planctomycetota bacterium]